MLETVILNTFQIVGSGMAAGIIVSVAILCVQQVLHTFEITTK